jgi:FMN-dependent NADH-azoreductase
MAVVAKKLTVAGWEAMLSRVETLSNEQLAELSVAVARRTALMLVSAGKPVAAKAKKPVAAAAAASDEEEAAPKAVNVHLLYNRMWIKHVKAYAKAHGWDTPFLKKVTPRGGESYMEEKSASMLTSAGHVYADTQMAPMDGDFMSLAKHWRDTEHEVWEAYVAENPTPVTVPKAKSPIAVKPAPAAAVKAAAMVPPKVVAKKLPVVAAAATVVPVPVPVIAKPRVKPAVKPVEPVWVCPIEGQGIWIMDGNQYIRDSEDLVWTVVVNADGQAEHGDWCGKWDENTKLFDTTVVDPRLEMADEDADA